MQRYAARFAAALEEIDRAGGDAPAKLAAYARAYADVLRDGRMCLCGMLAADYDTLPKPMRGEVVGFFDDNGAWLARVIEEGRAEGTLRPNGSASEAARAPAGSRERCWSRDRTAMSRDSRRLRTRCSRASPVRRAPE